MNEYRQIVIETYRNDGEPSRAKVRARPLPGQGFPVDLKVECSSSMRARHAVGTRFIVRCKLTDREGGTPFLYTSYQWPYRVVTDAEAEEFIRYVEADLPLPGARSAPDERGPCGCTTIRLRDKEEPNGKSTRAARSDGVVRQAGATERSL